MQVYPLFVYLVTDRFPTRPSGVLRAGTSGFVCAFLSLAGTYQISTWAAALCTTGIILGASYMLYLYRRIAFGEIVHDDVRAMPDLSTRELWLLAQIGRAHV